ncbi:MAG: hypothetical protein JWL92_412 [Candidatus Nomurabacteria bacterium]|nr:hypothetical protein [Candidatus Nomurabacteria bacterium]
MKRKVAVNYQDGRTNTASAPEKPPPENGRNLKVFPVVTPRRIELRFNP